MCLRAANRHNVVFVERIRCGEKNTNLSEIHESSVSKGEREREG